MMVLPKVNITKTAKILFPGLQGTIDKEICPLCYTKIKESDFKSRLSLKEYSISGMCQSCQDKTFGSEEKETPYCDCGNELISDEEERNKICRECK